MISQHKQWKSEDNGIISGKQKMKINVALSLNVKQNFRLRKVRYFYTKNTKRIC
jgi:hypothetical protein